MPIDVAARITANDRLSDDYNVLALEAPEIARLVEPGQFVMVKTTDGCDPLLRRPFSIFEITRDLTNSPTGFSLLIKRVGPGTSKLYEANVGQCLRVLGPLGRPFTLVNPPVDAWMIAGGVGLAPFLALAERLIDSGCTTTLFYGARRAAELYKVDLFEKLGVRSVLATEDGSRGSRGLITVPLAAELAAASRSKPLMLYACGPEPMLAAVAKLADEHQRRCEVSTERVMGCGMGGCFSCVVRIRKEDGTSHYLRSCTDGPVFDASQVVWS